MDFLKKQEIITQIENGVVFVEYEGETLLFKEPSTKLKLELLVVNKKNIADCLAEGFFSEDQEQEFLIEHGLCDGTEDETIKTLSEDLKKLKSQKTKFRFRSRELKKINSGIKVIEEKLTVLLQNKSAITDKTAKYQADIRTKHRLIQKSLFNLDGSLVWGTWEDFENETSIAKTNEFLLKVFYQVPFDEADLRKVAREEPWRSTWRTSCKTGTPVFDSPTAQFTENQKRLIYWSMVYDNVFESLECPTDDVVGNDDLLDLWFENQHEKSQKNKSKSGADSSLVTTNEKILGASEIFVPVDSKEDALNVYNELNTPEVRRNFQQKQKEIETKKEVKEQDLSQTKQQLRMMANQEGFRKNK